MRLHSVKIVRDQRLKTSQGEPLTSQYIVGARGIARIELVEGAVLIYSDLPTELPLGITGAMVDSFRPALAPSAPQQPTRAR